MLKQPLPAPIDNVRALHRGSSAAGFMYTGDALRLPEAQASIDKRAARIQAEGERVLVLQQAARQEGYDAGVADGWRSGSQLGLVVGWLLGLACLGGALWAGRHYLLA